MGVFAFIILLAICVHAVSFIPKSCTYYKRWTKIHRLSALRPFPIVDDSKYYNFKTLESDIYSWWEDNCYFAPQQSNGSCFSMVMPPPNVTGFLHMGHALFLALQDIIVRFKRMRGHETVWIPGEDHAGIATQLFVEKELAKLGTNRHEIGRERFLEEMWKWKSEKGNRIVQQIRRMGASADWSKERFTLDEGMCKAVTEAFIQLHNKGLIYRGDYMVNWSPTLQTAVSDLEVEHRETTGFLYYINYEIVSPTELKYVSVATTRPETIFGDTAVCVHPDDTRYSHLIGKKVKIPIVNREIPIIADESIDPLFGSGVVKVTPAHSVEDHLLAKKHNLTTINILHKNGTLNECGGVYEGLDRFVCRKQLWKDLNTSGAAVKAVEHKYSVPISQRSGDVIEKRLSSQWFLNTQHMAKRAIDSVRNKELSIIPERFEAQWYEWLNNNHDWCLSRQLSWGHRIPAFYVRHQQNNEEEGKQGGEYIVATSLDEAKLIAEKKYGPNVRVVQDEDVLDTWFSAGLWPFASLGWPNTTTSSDYSRYYPTTLLETGHDILFFWVARMVMLGLELTDKLPFKEVYLHGLVLDRDGQKMSKSVGNVMDPLETIDSIGCDALRMALVTGSTPGQDVRLSTEKLESQKNFVNKVWNMGKFIGRSINGSEISKLKGRSFRLQSDMDTLSVLDKYIISKCHETAIKVTELLEVYQFAEAGQTVLSFLWHEFADWYIEAIKNRLTTSLDNADKVICCEVLLYVWDCSLRLLHPFMPFITESLWQMIPYHSATKADRDINSIMMSEWPVMQDEPCPLHIDKEALDVFQKVKQLITALRTTRDVHSIEEHLKIEVTVVVKNDLLVPLLTQQSEVICKLAELDTTNFKITSYSQWNKDVHDSKSLHVVVDESIEVYIPLRQTINIDKEMTRLHKQKTQLEVDLQRLQTRLSSPGYIKSARVQQVNETKLKVTEIQNQLNSVEASLCLLVGNSKTSLFSRFLKFVRDLFKWDRR